MARLVVCPLSRLSTILAECGAVSVVTLLRHGEPAPRLSPGHSHLRLELSDIVEALDGHVLAAGEHIDRLFDFAETWDRRAPLLLHCYAGVSRSTAAAYVLACRLEPETAEAELACRLRSASPTATPNARLVALADRRLGRSGRMIAAIDAIGRGAECFEGEPFSLDVGR